MMFEEFQKLVSNKATYEEFEKINAIYMDCDTMSKADAAALWKKTYGKQRKVDAELLAKRASVLLESDVQMGIIANTLYFTRARDGKSISLGGIKWKLNQTESINHGSICVYEILMFDEDVMQYIVTGWKVSSSNTKRAYK